jgi:hypothetical protein
MRPSLKLSAACLLIFISSAYIHHIQRSDSRGPRSSRERPISLRARLTNRRCILEADLRRDRAAR